MLFGGVRAKRAFFWILLTLAAQAGGSFAPALADEGAGAGGAPGAPSLDAQQQDLAYIETLKHVEKGVIVSRLLPQPENARIISDVQACFKKFKTREEQSVCIDEKAKEAADTSAEWTQAAASSLPPELARKVFLDCQDKIKSRDFFWRAECRLSATLALRVQLRTLSSVSPQDSAPLAKVIQRVCASAPEPDCLRETRVKLMKDLDDSVTLFDGALGKTVRVQQYINECGYCRTQKGWLPDTQAALLSRDLNTVVYSGALLSAPPAPAPVILEDERLATPKRLDYCRGKYRSDKPNPKLYRVCLEYDASRDPARKPKPAPGEGGAGGDGGGDEGGIGQGAGSGTGDGKGVNAANPGQGKSGGQKGGVLSGRSALVADQITSRAPDADALVKGDPCPPKTDCKLLPSVPIENPIDWGDGPYFTCPSFMGEVNCQQLGSGKGGDLEQAFADPAHRDLACRRRLTKWVTGLRPEDYARSGVVEQRKSALAVLANSDDHSACKLWFVDINQQSIPPTTRDAIRAGATGTGLLQDFLQDISATLQSDYEKDLGVFSLQQEAVGVFSTMEEASSEILTNDVKFAEALATLSGAPPAALSCLKGEDRTQLELRIRASREQIRAQFGPGKTPTPSELQARWLDKLTTAAKASASLEKAEYTIGMMSARLGCERNAASRADLIVPINQDWKYLEQQDNVPAETVAARRAWFTTKFKALTGEDPGRYLTGDGVNCYGLADMMRTVSRQRNHLLDLHPLLADVDDSDVKVYKPRCATGGNAAIFKNPPYPVPEGHPFGAPDPAAGFEGKRLEDCSRPKTLGDRLAMGEGLAPALAAANKLKEKGFDRFKDICKDGEAGIGAEGKRASKLEGVIRPYLACGDIGEASKTCSNRRSWGPVMCRAWVQNAVDESVKRLHDFYKQVAMVGVTTVAMFVPGGQVIGLAMTGYGAYQMHQERKEAKEEHAQSWVDFNAGSVGYGQYKTSWEKMDDATKHYYFWQAANVVFAGLDAVQGVHFLSEVRAGRELEAMDQLFKDGKTEAAFARAKSTGKITEEATYARMKELEVLHPELAGSADRYVGQLRASLEGAYGADVQLLRAPADVMALGKFDGELQAAVKSGRVTVEESAELSQAALKAMESCRAIGGGCVALKVADLGKALKPAAIADARVAASRRQPAAPKDEPAVGGGAPPSEAPMLEHEVGVKLLAEYRSARAKGLLTSERETLLKRLGIHLGDEHGAGAAFPSSATFDTLFEDLMAEKKVDPKDRMIPTTVYKSPDNTIVYGQLGHPPPCAGCVESSALLTPEQFAKMLADGHYPLGSSASEVLYGGSAWTHDMFHFVGFAEHPEYMKQLRASAKEIAGKYKDLADEEAELKTLKPGTNAYHATEMRSNMTRFDIHNMNVRMNVAAEDAMTVKRDVDFTEELASLPSGMTSKTTVAKVEAHLKGLPEVEVQKDFKTIKDRFFSWVDTGGGTAGDVPQAMKRIDPARRSTESAEYAHINRTLLDVYHDLVQAFEGPPRPGTLEEQHNAMARMQVMMVRSQKVKLEDIAAAVKDGVKPGSAVFDLFCDAAVLPLGARQSALCN